MVNIIVIVMALTCILFSGILLHLLFLFALKSKIDLKKYHILTRFLVRTALIFMFSIVTIALAELVLRQIHTRFYHLAEVRLEPHEDRGFTPSKNSRYFIYHPDNETPHLVIHNNLGLHQHRTFDAAELQNANNLAFFGDSFTANVRMKSTFCFTEVLDHLLRSNKERKLFNTYNFGVDAYGLDQIYLMYKDFPYPEKLDHVFYVACYNDVKNIYDKQMCSINENNELAFKKSIGSSFLTRLVTRLYLTYFVIEIRAKLVNAKEKKIEDVKESYLEETIPIFQKILEEWRKDVESRGGKFHIVLLPRKESNSLKKIIAADFSVINLFDLFHEQIVNYDYDDFRFKNDYHWNEEGNQLAAIFLYKELNKRFSLGNLTNEQIKECLFKYYDSFEAKHDMLSSQWLKKTTVTNREKNVIRNRYTSLENQ